MSVSLCIHGFKAPDKQWQSMKSIWDACKVANIQPPKEVLEFFDHTYPGDAPGMNVEITQAMKPWGNDYSEGYEIDISKLPKDLTHVRCYMSY